MLMVMSVRRKFQFYKSTIITHLRRTILALDIEFQFYKSTIITCGKHHLRAG